MALAELRPDLFAAAISMASFQPLPAPVGLPLYVVRGEADELFPVERAREAVAGPRAAGETVELETPALSHYQAFSYVPMLDRAAAWVETEVWGATGPE